MDFVCRRIRASIIRSRGWLSSRVRLAAKSTGFISFNCRSISAMPEATTVIDEAAAARCARVVTSASLLQGRIPPQTAIEFVRSTPGITTALIGMSRVEHVEENLADRILHG